MRALARIGLWGDFPEKLQAATGAGVFAYSRAGYGASIAGEAAAPGRLHAIARRSMCCRSCWTGLASSAACCLAIPTARRSRRSMPARTRTIACTGIALIAPHFIVEDISVTSIAETKVAYETTNLKEKLARWHKDVGSAFYGWNERLARSGLPRLGYLRLSRLYPRARADRAGREDQYGTMRQVEIAQDEMLLPGRRRGRSRCRPFAASRGARSHARRGHRIRPRRAARRPGTGGLTFPAGVRPLARRAIFPNMKQNACFCGLNWTRSKTCIIVHEDQHEPSQRTTGKGGPWLVTIASLQAGRSTSTSRPSRRATGTGSSTSPATSRR